MIRMQDYEYYLPPELIAKEPAVPRDHSRLFIYNTQKNSIIFDHFSNLAKYLPQNSFLVLNETKVLPSRIVLTKQSGGKVNTFFLVNEQMDDPETMRVMVDRKVKVGERLFFNKEDSVEVMAQDKHLFTVKIPFGKSKLFELLEQKGMMPIPLYIKNSPLNRDELREKYQTVFARQNGSAAAPTASLHFTDNAFKSLDAKHIERLFITLHVGLGTFAPVSAKNISEKKLHEEWYEISEEILRCTRFTARRVDTSKQKGMNLIAVGTTVTRTLEAFAMSNTTNSQYPITKNQFPMSKTDLFIYPPYEFKMVDHLITNFHLPWSSLMMLIEAFLRYKKAKRSLIDLYEVAIKEKLRFYSFGDAMLIL